MDRVSIIIPGRHEQYFQKTIEGILENAEGDIEVIAIQDGDNSYPIDIDDNRVKVIELEKSIGQRAGYNLGVQNATGKYVMKLDAHALPSKGFDLALKENCPPETTVIPEMRRLDVKKWEPKPSGKTHFMYFGLDLYCHYWSAYRKRPEAKGKYPEVMTGQGSCWFCEKDWSNYIGLLDEGVGSWGNVGIEVSLRTWLCGGTQIINKNAWQAHWFRVSDGGFPYPMDGRKVAKAHSYTWNNYYFKDTAFEHQIRPFYWLIDKFKPVPTWEAYLSDEYKSPRTIVYYTDNQIEESLANAVRKNLIKMAGPIPIISVSQKPLSFGKNICVGEKPRSYKSIYEQILAGAEASEPGSIIYLCEHDVFYHPSHFAILPGKDKKAFYINQNRYYWHYGSDGFVKAKGKRAFSQSVIPREYLIDFLKKALDKYPEEVRFRRFDRESERPNVDVRHDNNFTKDGNLKKGYLNNETKKTYNIGGWGGVKHFQSTVKYKGPLRTDIIKYLIELYGYKSYLEIGVDRRDNIKYINCPVIDGVDPKGNCNYKMTSDEFFDKYDKKYDIIFIDGLHEAEQVKKDIANSLKCLNKGGVVVMHDCSPRNEAEQQVPPAPNQKIWTGDVWKAFVWYRRRKGLEMYVVDTNNGIGIIRKGKQEPLIVKDFDYKVFEKNKKEWLNLKTVSEFKEYENARK